MSELPVRWTTLEERDALRAAAGGLPVGTPTGADGRPSGGAHDDTHDDAAPDGGGDARLSRRGFLAATGFSMAGALVACGRAPTVHTVPGATAPEDVVAGRSTWYATTCGGCGAGCGLIVRCRDGRPVKVEGNPEHPVSAGGVCAVGQATVLGVYDSRRLLHPVVDGAVTTWAAADARVLADLERVRAAGGAVRLVTGTLTGPSTLAAVAGFLAAFPGARHVSYDALSSSATLDAHARTRGARILPRVHLERAETVLGLEADFLGTWVSPVELTRGWRAGRTLAGTPPRLSHHVQVESALTLTGSNADRRLRVEAGAVGAFAAHLAARLAAAAGLPAPATPDPLPVDAAAFDAVVARLWATRGRSVVLCGTNDVDVQTCVALANEALGAYGAVLDLDAPSFQRRGDDAAFAALLDELEAGQVGAVVVAGCNPVADAAGGARFAAALSKVAVRVGLAERPDETTAALAVLAPLPHALEAWDDAEPVAGVVSLTQPLVAPFGEPRTLRACLAAWAGAPAADLDLLRASWRRDVLPRLPAGATDEGSWRAALRSGFARVTASPPALRAFAAAAAAAAAPRARPAGDRFTLACVPSVALLDGRHAHNPWLQELPDPITKQVWGNAVLLSERAARGLRVADGDRVRVTGPGGASLTLPAIVVPGLPDRTVGVALGYGRAGTDRFAGIGPAWLEAKPTVARGGAVGANAAAFLRFERGAVAYAGTEVTVERAGGREDVARSQTYDRLEVPKAVAPHGGERRDPVHETTLAAFLKDQRAGHPPAAHAGADLWPAEHVSTGERWRMVVDLTACTGCSACVVSCQAENNIPVVGKDEVFRRRDMAWMRIDRYYADVPGADGEVDVVHQPMLCQHCENAPCETVCPVLATVHNADGTNGQVYNRCVGTRYCANNCPYKVRRFNWFDYARHDRFADLVLNPDVTVRSRGVMEKCSLCTQRLHEARAEARRLGRPLADGEARTACQQSCPASAIVFGDANDPKSAVARLVASDPRHYRVLEELNVKPSVGYLTKVRHRSGGGEGAERHG